MIKTANAIIKVLGNPEPTPRGATANKNAIIAQPDHFTGLPLVANRIAMINWKKAIRTIIKVMFLEKYPSIKSRYKSNQTSEL